MLNHDLERIPDLVPFLRASKRRTVVTFCVFSFTGASVGAVAGYFGGLGWRLDIRTSQRLYRALLMEQADRARKRGGR